MSIVPLKVTAVKGIVKFQINSKVDNPKKFKMTWKISTTCTNRYLHEDFCLKFQVTWVKTTE